MLITTQLVEATFGIEKREVTDPLGCCHGGARSEHKSQRGAAVSKLDDSFCQICIVHMAHPKIIAPWG